MGRRTASRRGDSPRPPVQKVASFDSGDKIYDLEIDLETDAVKWARRRGWYSRKFRAPGRRAAPDRIFVFQGRVLFIEFKRLGNEPTDQQREELDDLRKVGAHAIWLDSIEDFQAVILCAEDTGDFK